MSSLRRRVLAAATLPKLGTRGLMEIINVTSAIDVRGAELPAWVQPKMIIGWIGLYTRTIRQAAERVRV
jgi:hypothetical protein